MTGTQSSNRNAGGQAAQTELEETVDAYKRVAALRLAQEMNAATLKLYAENSDALQVALRCYEIWNAQRAVDQEHHTDGCYHFMSCVDTMLEASSDSLMVASPNDELFTFLFMRAAAEFKDEPAPNEYTELLDLIQRVDEGADLAELHRQEYPTNKQSA